MRLSECFFLLTLLLDPYCFLVEYNVWVGRWGVILPGNLKVESVIVEIGILENEILEIGILENEIVGILCPTEFRLSYFLSPRFSKLQPFHWT